MDKSGIETPRRTHLQRVHFWTGLWGLLFTLGIGAQFTITLGPWQGSISSTVSPGAAWSSIALGIGGMVWLAFGAIMLPLWVFARQRFDRMDDERRFRLVMLCWGGLIFAATLWVVSTALTAVVG